MKDPTVWVKLFFTYGPFAILVVLIVVTERKARTAMGGKFATQGKRWLFVVFVALYVLNWLATFTVMGYCVYFWRQMNIDRKPEINGRFERLSTSDILGTTAAELFLQRKFINYAWCDYEWKLVKDKVLPDGSTIVFTIQTPPTEKLKDGQLYQYELPVKSEFYTHEVMLVHDQNNVYLVEGSTRTKLTGQLIPPGYQPQPTLAQSRRSFDLIPSAYAQAEQTTIADFGVALQSPDAIVRRKARADLARADRTTALRWINGILEDPKSNYQLKLGVIVALNDMKGLNETSFTLGTKDAIQNALLDPDDTLRNQAYILALNTHLMPLTVWEEAGYAGRRQGFVAGRYRADRGQFGSLLNDRAAAIHVASGFRVRLCENEGGGKGAGVCEEHSEGWYALKSRSQDGVADGVSFIEVIALSKYKQSIKPK